MGVAAFRAAAIRRSKLRLDRLSDIAVLVASVAVVGTLCANWSMVLKKKGAAGPTGLYHVGDVIKDTSELHLTSAHKTLMVVTASTCHFCSESMGFYKTLLKSARSSGIQVVAATFEDVNINRRYLADHDVAVDSVISAESNGLLRTGTPALILLSQNGRVENWWLGKLGTTEETQVSEAVARHAN